MACFVTGVTSSATGGGDALSAMHTEPAETALPRFDVRVLAPRRVATAALLVVLLAALLLTVPSLGDVFDRFGAMRPGWVVAALMLEVLSCLAFVWRCSASSLTPLLPLRRAAFPGLRWPRALCFRAGG